MQLNMVVHWSRRATPLSSWATTVLSVLTLLLLLLPAGCKESVGTKKPTPPAAAADQSEQPGPSPAASGVGELVPEPPLDAGAEQATHEVFDTYKDPKGDAWLALNSEPLPKKGEIVARMPDGTGLVVEGRGYGRQGRWLKVRIVGGDSAGVVGYAHSKWIRQVSNAPVSTVEPSNDQAPTDGGWWGDRYENRKAAGSSLFLAWIFASDCRSLKLDLYKVITAGTVTKSMPIARLGGEYNVWYVKDGGGISRKNAQAYWESLDPEQPVHSLNSDHPLWAMSAAVIARKAEVQVKIPEFLIGSRFELLDDRVDPKYRWDGPSNAACRDALKQVAKKVIAECHGGGTASVDWIRFAARSECGLDPETPANSACGTTMLSNVTKDAIELPDWPEYACRDQRSAGPQWPNCLRFEAYSASTNESYSARWYDCPGSKRCCPPPKAVGVGLEGGPAREQQALTDSGARPVETEQPKPIKQAGIEWVVDSEIVEQFKIKTVKCETFYGGNVSCNLTYVADRSLYRYRRPGTLGIRWQGFDADGVLDESGVFESLKYPGDGVAQKTSTSIRITTSTKKVLLSEP